MPTPTRAERLQILLEKVHPPYKDFPSGGCCDATHGAIYELKESEPGKWKIRITDPVTGDSLGGVGETADAAITMLEGKIT